MNRTAALKTTLYSIPFALFPLVTMAQQPAGDLVVTNANIYTVDDAHPRAQAMVIRDGKVFFVGDNRGALAIAGANAQRMDVGGKTVLPGLIDAHGHLLNLGQSLKIVDLVGTTSYAEVVSRTAERAKTAKPGEWVRGRGWDQNHWGDTRFPTNAALSAAVPSNPVYLTRVDGHAGLVNAKALELAGITAKTPDPSGGRILKDSAGSPSGVLIDRAQDLVTRVIPPASAADVREAALGAIAELNKYGLTGVHEAGATAATIEVYKQLAREGKYNIRNYVMLRDSDAVLDRFMAQGAQLGVSDRLWIRSIKLYADGALGSRGAELLEPYSDDPANLGLAQDGPEKILAVAVKALKAGWQVNVHAIGDRGNREVLDQFERALQEVPKADHRFRIEHAQIINYADVPRFAKLGVIPSMQGSHATSDMYWAVKRLGPARITGAYPWRSLLNTGVIVPNGSDFPVESANPLVSFHSFFTRQDTNNWPPGGWMPEERTTRQEALESMTIWPAFASFLEKDLGTLSVGKYGDFVVLDQDIMTAPPEEILKTKVEMTVLGGRIVYKREIPKT